MAMNKDFGAFELKEKIGMGGMASVFLAVQKALQRPVVLKILHAHLADDEKLVQRFEREARAAAMMRHPNIIQVIDMGRHDDVAYIAMEYVEGMDLQKWLQAHGTPPLEMALLIVRDICRGLEHAHGNRIVHRDVKPANVMLTPDGMIKLMDFGLARGGSETSTQMTMVGSVLGTPAYMSPEQATGETVDERSDIFSTGVLAYELLGGQRPFAGDSYSTVLRSILTVEPREVTEFNPLVPDEVARIVRSMLIKDVGKRTQAIAQVLGDFEDVIEHMGLHRGKDLLREYASQPESVAAMWRKRHLSRHLDQGLYYENMGLGKIDDALREFRRVLYLDPDNAVAKDHARKLERERERLVKEGKGGDLHATVIMAPGETPPAGAAPQTPAPPTAADPDATIVGAPPPLPARPPAAAKPAQPPAPPAPAKPAPAKAAATAAKAATPAVTPAKPAGPAKRGLPVPALAAIGAVLVVAAVAIVMAMTRGPGGESVPAGRDANASIPAGSDSAFAAAAPADSPAAIVPPATEAGTPAVPAKPTIDDARRALDEGRYAEAITLSRELLAGSLPGRQRRLGLEIVARALAGQGRAGDAQTAFADLMKRFPAYTPDPSLTSLERAAYDAAKAAADRGAATPPAPPVQAPAPVEAPATTRGTGDATLVVKVEPFADFYLDDQRLDGNKKLFRTTVKPGTHKVLLKHPSLGNREWTVTLAPGQTRELEYDFTSLAGSITVTSEPTWGDIYMDGVRIGHTTPWTISPVPPGVHDITLVREGYVVEGGAQRVDVKIRDKITLNFRLKKK